MLGLRVQDGVVVGPTSLGGDALLRLERALERELSNRLGSCELDHTRPPRELTRSVLVLVLSREFGVQDPQRVVALVAPIVRRAWLAHLSRRSDEAERSHLAQFERWLERLEGLDPLSALMVDLHYFAGLSIRETATVVGVSVETVFHDLRSAKAWLFAFLGKHGATRS